MPLPFLHRLFAEQSRIATVERGTLITSVGDVEQHIYLVHAGAVRAYCLNGHEEQTVRFGYEGSIITSLASFLRQEPSELYLEAIRKTTLSVLNRATFTERIETDDTHRNRYISLLEELVAQQIDREIDLLIPSPAERLERVLQRSPKLFQHVPLRYIANYLRMTPETLSRIRNS